MRKADLKSLVWLARWYGGRAKRMAEIHQAHLGNLQSLVLDELGGIPQDEATLSFYGFSVTVSFGATGIEVSAITPPTILNGDQLLLFAEDDAEWLAEDCESTETEVEATN